MINLSLPGFSGIVVIEVHGDAVMGNRVSMLGRCFQVGACFGVANREVPEPPPAGCVAHGEEDLSALEVKKGMLVDGNKLASWFFDREV